MGTTSRLFGVADSLEKIGNAAEVGDFLGPLKALDSAAEEVGKAWCGSWLGYHSRVYYANFLPAPPGIHFSQEWGLSSNSGKASGWMECDFDDVVSHIYELAGNPDISEQESKSAEASEEFEELHAEALSCMAHAVAEYCNDKFLEGISEKMNGLRVFSSSEIVRTEMPRGSLMSRDRIALQGGVSSPPHIGVSAKVNALRHPFYVCIELGRLCRRAASHLQNMESHAMAEKRVGTNVFIGHGRSPLWRELKDFVQDRMHLPWDEFNRVPVAGVTNIARLAQMLDEAAIAFLIMTGEDEQSDGKQHARQNVIHEAGLFQGRLGFEKAIILLEAGCEEFSNVQGLSQIHFPKGNVSAAFEKIRQVLEREGLVGGG